MAIGLGLGLGVSLVGNQWRGILDSVTGAAAAYSTRKLSSRYMGACLRVRRSSDNAEQDIGFTGNSLNTTALLAFVGAGDGFVATWYDQSGGAQDISQPTAGNQPRIVASGAIETANGFAGVRFVRASENYLFKASEFPGSAWMSYLAVLTTLDLTGIESISDSNSGNRSNTWFEGGSIVRMYAGLTMQSAYVNTAGIRSLGFEFRGSQSKQYIANTVANTGDTGAQTISSLRIGARFTVAGEGFNGHIHEFIALSGVSPVAAIAQQVAHYGAT